MGECQQVVARTNKECVGLHQTTNSGCDMAPVIEMLGEHGVDNTNIAKGTTDPGVAYYAYFAYSAC